MIAPLLLAAACAALALQDTSRLTLTQALRRALDHYPTVSAARAGLDQASAAAGEASSARLPRLALDASVSRSQEPNIVYPLHGLSLTPGSTSAMPVFDQTLGQAALGLSWTLWDFGARGGRIRAARATADAAGASLDAARAAIAGRVAVAYLRVLTAQGVLAALDQRLASLEAEADRVHRLMAVGRAARVEVLRIEAEALRARADRVGGRTALDVAERELAQLAGVSPDEARAARLEPLRLADTTDIAPRRAALVERALAANPDLRQARLAADAGRAGLAAARATRFPELRLSGSWVDRGGADHEFRAEWSTSVQISYPLFTGGQRASSIRRADADYRARSEQARLAAMTAEQAVDRALAALSESHARVAALEQAAAQFDEVVRIRRLALETGSGTQTDYLGAETDLLRARASAIEARHAEIAARVELARVTGELTPEWLAAAVRAATDPVAPTQGRTEGPR